MHIFVWEEAGRNPHRPNVKGELHTERPHCDVTLLTTGSLCCSQNESDVLCPQKSEELIISGLQLWVCCRNQTSFRVYTTASLLQGFKRDRVWSLIYRRKPVKFLRGVRSKPDRLLQGKRNVFFLHNVTFQKSLKFTDSHIMWARAKKHGYNI